MGERVAVARFRFGANISPHPLQVLFKKKKNQVKSGVVQNNSLKRGSVAPPSMFPLHPAVTPEILESTLPLDLDQSTG